MERVPTVLDGPVLIEPRAAGDARGFFLETYREALLAERFGITDRFVQDNHSRSRRGVLRGMHVQFEPPAAKLVRCGRGAILDVLVDVRPDSPQFGRWEAFELSDENLRVLYAPAGFAHGFCVLSDVADVLYKQSAYWTPDADLAVAHDDPEIGIEWPIPAAERIVSERDRAAQPLRALAERLRG